MSRSEFKESHDEQAGAKKLGGTQPQEKKDLGLGATPTRDVVPSVLAGSDRPVVSAKPERQDLLPGIDQESSGSSGGRLRGAEVQIVEIDMPAQPAVAVFSRAGDARPGQESAGVTSSTDSDDRREGQRDGVPPRDGDGEDEKAEDDPFSGARAGLARFLGRATPDSQRYKAARNVLRELQARNEADLLKAMHREQQAIGDEELIEKAERDFQEISAIGSSDRGKGRERRAYDKAKSSLNGNGIIDGYLSAARVHEVGPKLPAEGDAKVIANFLSTPAPLEFFERRRRAIEAAQNDLDALAASNGVVNVPSESTEPEIHAGPVESRRLGQMKDIYTRAAAYFSANAFQVETPETVAGTFRLFTQEIPLSDGKCQVIMNTDSKGEMPEAPVIRFDVSKYSTDSGKTTGHYFTLEQVTRSQYEYLRSGTLQIRDPEAPEEPKNIAVIRSAGGTLASRRERRLLKQILAYLPQPTE